MLGRQPLKREGHLCLEQASAALALRWMALLCPLEWMSVRLQMSGKEVHVEFRRASCWGKTCVLCEHFPNVVQVIYPDILPQSTHTPIHSRSPASLSSIRPVSGSADSRPNSPCAHSSWDDIARMSTRANPAAQASSQRHAKALCCVVACGGSDSIRFGQAAVLG